MKLLSVNVGLPREIDRQGKSVRTSIFKAPVSSGVRVTRLNVEGDQQSDLSVHGGIDKAVYVYPLVWNSATCSINGEREAKGASGF